MEEKQVSWYARMRRLKKERLPKNLLNGYRIEEKAEAKEYEEIQS